MALLRLYSRATHPRANYCLVPTPRVNAKRKLDWKRQSCCCGLVLACCCSLAPAVCIVLMLDFGHCCCFGCYESYPEGVLEVYPQSAKEKLLIWQITWLYFMVTKQEVKTQLVAFLYYFYNQIYHLYRLHKDHEFELRSNCFNSTVYYNDCGTPVKLFFNFIFYLKLNSFQTAKTANYKINLRIK